MAKRMVLLLLLLLPVGLGGCYWHDGGREGYRPGDYRQAGYPQGYGPTAWNFRQGANTPGHAYDGQLR
jgi:hypothetical protein